MATDTAEANPDVVATAAKVESADKNNGETTKEPAAKKAKLDDGGAAAAGAAAAAAEERDFDEETQKALEEIDANQNEIDVLNEKASEEILKVEQKYNKLRRPFYDRRNDIIKRIPKFWLTAFINHPQLSAVIEEDEEDALQYLNRLEVEEFEDIKSGYRIKLHFDAASNPYFANAVLTKEFLLSSGEPSSTSTPIEWREGKDLQAKVATMKAAAAAGNKPGSRKRFAEARSFFSWYGDNAEPAADDIAEVIKDDLWPNPLQYFLVPDVEVENGGEDEDDDLEDEEEEDDEGNVVVLEEEEEELEEEDGEGEEEEAEEEG